MRAVPFSRGCCVESYDWARGRRLWDEGVLVRDIAGALGCSVSAVLQARARYAWPARRPAQAERMRAWHQRRRAEAAAHG